MDTASKNPISGHLRGFLANINGENISFRQIVESFEEREYALLSLFFALIAAIPIPGVHAILGLPIFLLSVQRIIGINKMWMPEMVMKQTISTQAFSMMVDKAIPYIEKIERFCKPRFQYLVQGKGVWVLAIICAFFSCVIVVPGPLTNFIPSICIAVIAIGILMQDGLIALIGAIIGILFSIFLIFIYIAAIILVIQSMIAWL